MKSKYVLIAICLCVLVGSVMALKSFTASMASKKGLVHPSGTLSLVTEPDDGVAPVLALINGVTKSLDLVIYELDDAQVEAALAADERRGVAVRVLLGAGYNGAPSTTPATVNASAYDFLRGHGVPVRWSPGYFSLTHQKTLVEDGSRALIMTFNLVSKYYATGRDFGVMDGDARDVAAIEDTFNDDWKGSGSNDPARAALGGNNGDEGDDLLWSPGSAPALLEFINGARKSLYIYNEEMADADVTKALIDAAQRGVAVYVVMTGADEWKWQFAELSTAGAHVRTYADTPESLYIHAKMIVADAGGASVRAFIGSENFSAASLGENRELGIVLSDKNIIASLVKTFTADWRDAIPFTQ